MKFYEVIIETLEPVIIGYDSSNESRDVISGTALNGIFIKENIKNFDKISDIILSKDIIFTDAYLKKEKTYCIPTPKSFLCDKHDMKSLKNRDNNEKPINIKNGLLESKKDDDKKTEGLGSKYVSVRDEKTIELISLDKTENMHINRNIKEGMDSLYRYEAIEKGQKFYSLVILKDEKSLKEEHLKKIEGIRLIGKSKSAGYGKIKIAVNEIKYENFKENLKIAREDKIINEKQILNIYFLTDAILKDKYGNTVSILPENEIEKLFKLENIVKLDEQFVTNKIIGGYNSYHRIPMPKDMAVEAGSIIRYSYEGTLSEEIIKKIEKNGIGYFRERGFGRVIVNPDFSQDTLANYKGNNEENNDKDSKNDEISINLNEDEDKMFLNLKRKINEARELDKMYKIITSNNQNLVVIDKELENSLVNNLIKDILEENSQEDYGTKKDKVYNDRNQINIFGDSSKYFLKNLKDGNIEKYRDKVTKFIENYNKEIIKKFVTEVLYYHLRGKENE